MRPSRTGTASRVLQLSEAAADTVGSLGPWPSLLLVAACATAVTLVALLLLRRRDA